MAEAIFKQQSALTNRRHIKVESAGLSALVGHPMDDTAQSILREHDIDGSKHQARQLTEEMLLNFDLVLAMENDHRRQIERLFPSACGKVHLLGKWGDFEILDPYRKTNDFFKFTYNLIMQGTTQWQAKLWK